MPLRFPPAQPDPLPRGATVAQMQRFTAAYQAWLVGTALREYAKTLHTQSRNYIPDDLSLLPSPRYDSPSGGRRLNENGTPASMDEICAWIDREARTVRPIATGYHRLRDDLPRVASVVWLRHVDLCTIEEIAVREGLSQRTVLRYLGVAHLRLTAGMEYASGAKRTARRLYRKADTAEAQVHRAGNFEGAPGADELAESGLVVIERPRLRRVRVRKR